MPSAQLDHPLCHPSTHCRLWSLPSSHWCRAWLGLLWRAMQRELAVPPWLGQPHLPWAYRPVAWPKVAHPSSAWQHPRTLQQRMGILQWENEWHPVEMLRLWGAWGCLEERMDSSSITSSAIVGELAATGRELQLL